MIRVGVCQTDDIPKVHWLSILSSEHTDMLRSLPLFTLLSNNASYLLPDEYLQGTLVIEGESVGT